MKNIGLNVEALSREGQMPAKLGRRLLAGVQAAHGQGAWITHKLERGGYQVT